MQKKKQQEETDKLQDSIVTENNLFKDFIWEDVRNYGQK